MERFQITYITKVHSEDIEIIITDNRLNNNALTIYKFVIDYEKHRLLREFIDRYNRYENNCSYHDILNGSKFIKLGEDYIIIGDNYIRNDTSELLNQIMLCLIDSTSHFYRLKKLLPSIKSNCKTISFLMSYDMSYLTINNVTSDNKILQYNIKCSINELEVLIACYNNKYDIIIGNFEYEPNIDSPYLSFISDKGLRMIQSPDYIDLFFNELKKL